MAEQFSGGQGVGLAILTDSHRERADIRLAGRAVREKWPVTNKAAVVERLMAIIEKREVTIMTKEGPAMVDAPADANAVAAARVLVAMEKQNRDDERSEVDTRNTQGRVIDVDSRRLRLAQIAERIGTG